MTIVLTTLMQAMPEATFAPVKPFNETPGVQCLHCQFGHSPVRLRRRWVHHFKDTGTMILCEDMNLKPGLGE